MEKVYNKAHNLARPGNKNKSWFMKTFGVGVDIERIDRFKKLNRVYTAIELRECFKKLQPEHSLAARFAGKEAIFKALCDAGLQGVRYNQIEIRKDMHGVPRVKLKTGRLKRFEAHLSLSHSSDSAIAFAVLVGKKS